MFSIVGDVQCSSDYREHGGVGCHKYSRDTLSTVDNFLYRGGYHD